MSKYDEILDALAKQHPVLDDADALCCSIMDSLPDKSPVLPRWALLVRAVSSIAAVFFLYLFVFQSSEMEMLPSESPHHVGSLASGLRSIRTEDDFREYIELKAVHSVSFSNYKTLYYGTCN